MFTESIAVQFSYKARYSVAMSGFLIPEVRTERKNALSI